MPLAKLDTRSGVPQSMGGGGEGDGGEGGGGDGGGGRGDGGRGRGEGDGGRGDGGDGGGGRGGRGNGGEGGGGRGEGGKGGGESTRCGFPLDTAAVVTVEGLAAAILAAPSASVVPSGSQRAGSSP